MAGKSGQEPSPTPPHPAPGPDPPFRLRPYALMLSSPAISCASPPQLHGGQVRAGAHALSGQQHALRGGPPRQGHLRPCHAGLCQRPSVTGAQHGQQRRRPGDWRAGRVWRPPHDRGQRGKLWARGAREGGACSWCRAYGARGSVHQASQQWDQLSCRWLPWPLLCFCHPGVGLAACGQLAPRSGKFAPRKRQRSRRGGSECCQWQGKLASRG